MGRFSTKQIKFMLEYEVTGGDFDEAMRRAKYSERLFSSAKRDLMNNREIKRRLELIDARLRGEDVTIEKKKGNPNRRFDDPATLAALIDAYFLDPPTRPEVTKDGRVVQIPTITMSGLAIALGFATRQALYDYEKDEEFGFLIKSARLRVENAYENSLYGQRPTGAIFALKNMGWNDQQVEPDKEDLENVKIQVEIVDASKDADA